MDKLFNYLENIEVLDEIIPIIVISLIGSCIHEYIFKSNRYFFFNYNIWISTIITSILCFAIDPFIMAFNTRLVFLPPLLIGLSGMDLVQHLSTVKGNMTILEYILSFVGINRKDREDFPDTKDDKHSQNSYEELDNLLSIFFYLVSTVLSHYYTNQDNTTFLKKYHFLKKDFDLLNNEMIKYKTIPVTSTLLFSSIIKKVIELDNIYANIVRSSNSFTTLK